MQADKSVNKLSPKNGNFFPREILRRILSHLPWAKLNAMAGDNVAAQNYLSKEVMEVLFSRYFPHIYHNIRTKGVAVTDWRAQFLVCIEKGYQGCPQFQIDLFIAIGDHDIDAFRKCLAELQNTEALYRPHKLDMSPLECAALNGFDEGCSEAWKYIKNEPLYPLLQLRYAVMLGRPLDEIEEVIEMILREGNVSRTDILFRVLEESCLYGHSLAARYAVQDPVVKNTLSTEVFSDLVSRVCVYNRVSVMKTLLDNNPPETWINSPHLFEALWIACQKGRTEIAEGLLTADPAALNRPNPHGLTLLGFMCNPIVHSHVIKYLLEKGANITVLMNKHLMSLLHLIQGDEKIPMSYFLQKWLESYLQYAKPTGNRMLAATGLLNTVRNPSQQNIDKLSADEYREALDERPLKFIFELYKGIVKKQAHIIASQNSRRT